MQLNDIIKLQKKQIEKFFKLIDDSKIDMLSNILSSCEGNIIFYGIGKSENVCTHFSTLLSSIGIKSLTMSAQNCLHGDIGFISKKDIVIYISNSGNTVELLNIAPSIITKTNNVYGIFTNNKAKLIEFCNNYFILPKLQEIDRFKTIPTSSITEYILLANITVSYIIEIKNIKIEDYACNHPEGTIGKKLYKTAKDYMLSCDKISLMNINNSIKDCMFDICKKCIRCSVITNSNNEVIGIITDGNIRRYLSNINTSLYDNIEKCINYNPHTIHFDKKMIETVELIKNDYRLLSGIPVVDNNNKIVGLITQQQVIDYSF